MPVAPHRSAFALFLFALGLTVGVVGCSSTAPTAEAPALPDAFPNHSLEAIQTQIRQSTDTLRRFTATARVRIRTPEQSRSFNAQIRQRRADSLYMRFSLFGVEGGRLLLTPDSVFIYDARSHRLQFGPVAVAQQIFPIPVGTGRVFENMLGLLAPAGTTDWSVQADSMRYYLADPTDQERFTIDPRRWRALRYVKESASGRVLEERVFSNFKSVQGIQVPHRVQFRRPPDKLMALITYQDIHLNSSDSSFELNVPDQIPREPIR